MFRFGLALALLIAAALFFYVQSGPDSRARAKPEREPERIAEIRPASEHANRQPVAGSLPVIATAYECNGPSGRVLSDKPCGENAQVREVLAPNRMDAAPPPTNTSSADVHTSARPRYMGGERVSNGKTLRCARIDEQIERINARMRKKYTNREGEVFREQLRDLSDQHRDEKCGRSG